jgi:hypothetical protein
LAVLFPVFLLDELVFLALFIILRVSEHIVCSIIYLKNFFFTELYPIIYSQNSLQHIIVSGPCIRLSQFIHSRIGYKFRASQISDIP